jgi:hypothetical protein
MYLVSIMAYFCAEAADAKRIAVKATSKSFFI